MCFFRYKGVSVKVIFLLMLMLVVLVQTASAKNFDYEDTTLKNGMQVVLVPNHKVPAVSHMVWYKVGAQDEEVGKTGLAHLFEHLMFKATEHLESGEFSSRVAKAGGNDNAFTHYDYTAYYQNIARDTLPMVMEMEADRMQHLLLTEEQLEREKLVVLEERRMRLENNPLALLAVDMDQALFKNHPYGRPIIGWTEDIKSVSVDAATDFYRSYYAPNNAILVVVGDMTMDELKPMAERYYGQLKRSNIPERKILGNVDLPNAQTIIREDARVQKPQWLRFYVAPQYRRGCRECFALTMLSYLLAESQTSLLYEKLVVEKKIATSISSNYDDLLLGPATFSISATPAPDVTIEQLEKEIEAEIIAAQTNAFSEEKVARAKEMMAAQAIYAQEDFSSLARIFGSVYVLGLDGEYVKNWEKNIRSVTASEIKSAAQHVLKNQHAITGWLMPKLEKEVMQNEQ